ncbi:uncharacterized protein L969DRAFT_517877 [Mixia osmundae IAM 14324]|uniref:uncharacterized protein n=1 Tax=Mixia osmundae (strain CBS 9802 / IAM 14324 / JCM 22182 / KY 12970) TaxID=764103 RepID=UPI0004A54C34|nr:uncharacterized protein L969DRAFT_517877 [Mixia osmundae IAM 14324]KEI38214.1 hypothetical protein L969DRAFT_517877 [Mixia osmundae IAM 14324]
MATTVGDDGYIHYGAASSRAGNVPASTGSPEASGSGSGTLKGSSDFRTPTHSRNGSTASGSTAPLTASARRKNGTTGKYISPTHSRGDSLSSMPESGYSNRSGDLDKAYRAGMPIGLLAAMGTPYAKKPLYRSTKCKVLCLAVLPIIVIVVVLITVFPVLQAIAKHALHTSVLHIYTSNLTFLANDSFALTLDGEATKTGIFPAHIFFHRPVEVYWINPDNMGELMLGTFPLEYLGAAAGHGRIHQETFFTITDAAGFGRFAEYLITQEAFTWRLRSGSVQAKAFSFLGTRDLEFVKDLTLPGMANFTNVAIADFQLPGDDPAGGITLDVVTTLTNPSAFGVEVGTLMVDLFYQDLYLGPAQTSQFVNLTSGFNSFPLTGRLLSYAGNQTALAQLGVLFTNYVNGDSTLVTAVGRSVTLPNGDSIAWLNQGIRALQLIVPLKSPTGPLNPIKDIQIQTFSLTFPGAPTSYQPTAASNNLMAGIGLPFGFSLNISAVAAQITIVQNYTNIAQVQGVTGAATTILNSVNAGFTTGTLALILPPSPLVVPDTYEGHLIYSQFQKDFTATNGSSFFLNGTTTATTSTPIGEIILNPVNFYVPAGLIGLQLLQTAPTLILSVDVTGGTPEFIELNILVGLTNPSNLLLDVGDVTFQLFRNGDFLGRTILPSLSLSIGYQTHTSIGQFEANNNPTALDTLNRFTQGLDSQLSIGGYNGSSPYDSLQQAFMALQLNATLGGLQTQLLNYAALTVLPTTNFADNIADATVSLQNPFTSVLDITNIQSNITSRGLYLGSIVTDTNFIAGGKTATISPALPFGLNLYPPDIFSLLRELAVEAGLDPAYIDGIVQLGGYEYVPTSGPGTRKVKRAMPQEDEDDATLWADFGASSLNELLVAPGKVSGSMTGRHASYLTDPHRPERAQHRLHKRNLYTGFDLPTYVDTAFKQLTVNVALVSVVSIGQFTTDLTYSQADVPVVTDQTLNLLLPVLALPIVQKIVDGAVLAVDTVTITNPMLNSFGTGLTGSITQSGPFDAVISFPQGLTVAWNGAPLGQIAMPDVSLVGDVGATLNLQAAFSVADVGHLTDFTSYLLTEKSFTWEIFGQNLDITALGISVPGVSISKTVVLAGMDSFIGDVLINSFDLPANDPAGGITLTLQTTLTNPASVGVQLSTIAFENTFGATDIGPAASTAAFVLPPKGTLQLPLAGRLIPQTTQQGLDDVSTIFNGFVHGVPAQLLVHGVTAGPDGVTWLNDGIKALAIPVTLPAAASLQIINSITLNQLTLLFTTATSWSPSFSTSNTVAAFQLPFAFPLDITAASTNIVSQDAGTDFALITVPQIPTTTDVTARLLTLAFQNVPFAVDPTYSNQHATFSQFLTDTTDGVNKSFVLHGTASTVAQTAVGALNINEIPFQVTTEIAGLQGLNAQPATVSNLDVFHGYPDYLQINVNAHIFNPSEITIGTGDVSFGLTFMNTAIGTADITNLVLVPDQNTVPTAVHYSPQGDAAVAVGQMLLENFVQGIPSSTVIIGSADTTPIDSLKQALSTIKLGTVIPPLMQNLITQANLVFPLDIVQTGIAQATFNLDNPFTAAINLNAVDAFAMYPLTTPPLQLGNITQPNLDPVITAAGHTQITSRQLPFNFNLDPKTIIQLLVAQAAKNNVDLGPLVDQFNYVLGLESTATSISTAVDTAAPTCVSGTQFDVFGAILNSLKNLDVSLSIQSQVHLDDYGTALDFNQFNIPTITDSTALYLIGAVGPTIVQRLVDQAVLQAFSATINMFTDTSFLAGIVGTLRDTGPFDAAIAFPDQVIIDWNGATIATIALPNLCAFAVTSIPSLITSGTVTITDEAAFDRFATFLLHNPSFDWFLHTPALQVTALGTFFNNVNFGKTITLAAFNDFSDVAVSNLDVFHGFPSYLQINLDATLNNPSNLTIDTQQVVFNLVFENQVLGTAIIPDLALVPGSNTLPSMVHFMPSGDGAVAAGNTLLENFIQAVPTTAQIQGTTDSTPYVPLKVALSTLTLNTVIPPLMQNLITQAQLTFPLDIVQTGIAQATFNLDNPFTAAINLQSVVAMAIYPLTNPTLNLGNISQANLNPEITAPGHTQITSRTLPFNFNLDPKTIIRLLVAQAAKNNVDLGPLVDQFNYVLGLASTATTITTAVDTGAAPCVSGQQFDVFGAILNSLKNLDVNLQIQSGLSLDDYSLNLAFNQFDIPTITDSTALYLIGAVGPTIVQRLVDQATLTVAYADVFDVTDNGFTTTLHGILANTGPFDAYIGFPQGLLIDWMGMTIANIALPDLCAAATTSIPNLVTNGVLTITDQSAFVQFATYILHNPSFDWFLHTADLQVTALGTIFSNVNFGKTITLAAFNGLPGVTIMNFDLPGDAPNNAGINILTGSMIPSPAQLGIDLGTANFVAKYSTATVGPIHNTGDLFLAHQATTTAQLAGIIQKQPDASLPVIGQLFSQFLRGLDSTLAVTGDSVVSTAQPNSPVMWLTTAFKTLTLQVILPGTVYTIIDSILLRDLEVTIINADQAYAVPSSNKETDATYTNPFTFSLRALSTAVHINVAYAGVPTATLDLPSAPVQAGVTTGQPAPLVLGFTDVPLVSVNDDQFNAFFAEVTDTQRADFSLQGTADVVAQTASGDFPISGIPFGASSEFPTVAAINTYLDGINSFGGTATIPNTPITIGSGGSPFGAPGTFGTNAGNDFIRITINPVQLTNPSTVSVTTNDISLAVTYIPLAEDGGSTAPVGLATIAMLDLVPMANSVISEFHFTGTDAASLQLVTKYLTNVPAPYGHPIDIRIDGTQASSDYGSLKDALDGVSLTSSFPGIGARLVDRITIYVNLAMVVCQMEATFTFTVKNPLEAAVLITQVRGTAYQPSASLGEVPYATFDQAISFRAEPTATSGQSPIVTASLPQPLTQNLVLVANADNFHGSTVGLDVDLDIDTTVQSPNQETGGFPLIHLSYAEVIIPYDVVFVPDNGAAESGSTLPISVPDLSSLGPALLSGVIQCFTSGVGMSSFFLPVIGSTIATVEGVVTSIGGRIGGISLVGDLTDAAFGGVTGVLAALGISTDLDGLIDTMIGGIMGTSVAANELVVQTTSYTTPSIIRSLYTQCASFSSPCQASLRGGNTARAAAITPLARIVATPSSPVTTTLSLPVTLPNGTVVTDIVQSIVGLGSSGASLITQITSQLGVPGVGIPIAPTPNVIPVPDVTVADVPVATSIAGVSTVSTTDSTGTPNLTDLTSNLIQRRSMGTPADQPTPTTALLPRPTKPPAQKLRFADRQLITGNDGRRGYVLTLEEALTLARNMAEDAK